MDLREDKGAGGLMVRIEELGSLGVRVVEPRNSRSWG